MQDRLRINGPKDDAKRATNTLSVSIKGVNASLLLLELKVREVVSPLSLEALASKR